MPKTLSTSDPNLQEAVKRLDRTQKTTGWILIGYGVFTQLVAVSTDPLHPVAGLPFLAIGFFTLIWGDPALLAASALLLALAVVPALTPAVSVLGPDPVVQLTEVTGIELLIVVGVKAVLAFNAMQQFLLFRWLYGTERASSDEPNLAIIPPMVVNRSDRLARWSRSTGLIAAGAGLLALGFLAADPAAYAGRVVAELAGALAAVAAGLGLGAAFSPTDERPAALLGLGAGLVSYLLAAFVLLRLG
ncbi:MAG: hypothetical protein JNK29_08910 [Anaerolineales bacterium]|nr:hypothetical protein [Anaerolineales bacterium]